jgi:hypothetical protein
MSGTRLLSAGVIGVAALAVGIAPGTGARVSVLGIRVLEFRYVAHDGSRRPAFVALPRWYGPGHDPPLPLVISPHGRGIGPRVNLGLWGKLPDVGRFAVVSPGGQGRKLKLYSWGDPGDIEDLSRMPQFVQRAFPWLHVDPNRVYAAGESMGGQETLLLLARDPRLLAGAAAFDAPTRMALRYREFGDLRHAGLLRMRARLEIGGTPWTDGAAYRDRSPLTFARRIAFSGVRLQIWWSREDRIVVDQRRESGLLYREVEAANPAAPVEQVIGDWPHGSAMRATTLLPLALGRLGLLDVSAARPGRCWRLPAPRAQAFSLRGSAVLTGRLRRSCVLHRRAPATSGRGSARS